jgi:hypothetical protein
MHKCFAMDIRKISIAKCTVLILVLHASIDAIAAIAFGCVSEAAQSTWTCDTGLGLLLEGTGHMTVHVVWSAYKGMVSVPSGRLSKPTSLLSILKLRLIFVLAKH